ncbi:Maf-like protein [Caenibius tardaugens NBRC 16725]|uniref:Nucleoside triphosphate pyrophosphatase n=1 Tax=Caenibius tardaugens NBRC 16725 TaxID=1219035 RepID=U2YK70_9SPHN|nr:Maf family protein [Caenibius tardaugens]AZI36006.1 septum formation protein Maf [Caenibius tardaugens NBRC 16725]GAD48930.1 Maf-like protein [Caenibius tardaugens NBRC 16725]
MTVFSALVLASKSASRRAMLDAVGVAYRCVPANIDERALEANLQDTTAHATALALAEAKALAVSQSCPGELVLGSDSLVVVDGRRFDKPVDRDNAAEHLRFFSGRMMELHSAAALAQDGQIVWQAADCARLQVRPLSEEFIGWYLQQEWPAVSGCVGVFRIEALGPHLFATIEGDQFTVLGMPLLSVLDALRQYGGIPA